MKLIGWVLVLVVIVAVAGGVYYYFLKPGAPLANLMPAGEENPGGENLPPGAEVIPSEESNEETIGTQGTPDEASFRWTFAPVGSDASPKTKVTFHYNLGNKELGTFDGSCTRLSETAWPALPGEVDGAICYFAGFGTELAIFKEGTLYVAKEGVLEEGSEETGSVRGNFEVIERL